MLPAPAAVAALATFTFRQGNLHGLDLGLGFDFVVSGRLDAAQAPTAQAFLDGAGELISKVEALITEMVSAAFEQDSIEVVYDFAVPVQSRWYSSSLS